MFPIRLAHFFVLILHLHVCIPCVNWFVYLFSPSLTLMSCTWIRWQNLKLSGLGLKLIFLDGYQNLFLVVFYGIDNIFKEWLTCVFLEIRIINTENWHMTYNLGPNIWNKVKIGSTKTFRCLLLQILWLLWRNFNFWKRDWTLGCVSSQIWDFCTI